MLLWADCYSVNAVNSCEQQEAVFAFIYGDQLFSYDCAALLTVSISPMGPDIGYDGFALWCWETRRSTKVIAKNMLTHWGRGF